MKVLMVEPGKVPYVTKIRDDLNKLQEAVGGNIEVIYPWQEPVALICNENGKINGLPLNRALYDEDGQVYEIIAGKFFIAGLGEENFADLSDRLATQFYEQFKYPERFWRTERGFVVVKQPIQIRKDEHALSDTETAPKPKRSGRSI